MARAALRKLVGKLEKLHLSGEATNGLEAFHLLQQRPVDLLLLDVEMPEMGGLDLLRSLKTPPQVILITSKPDYAVDAFGLQVLDYLIKPVTLTRLVQAVDRIPLSNKQEAIPNNIFLRIDNSWKRIDYDQILYAEAKGDYVQLVTPTKKHLLHMTLSGLADKLPASLFFRCHRSFLIALDKIESIADNMIVINKEVIPLSEKAKKELWDRIKLNG